MALGGAERCTIQRSAVDDTVFFTRSAPACDIHDTVDEDFLEFVRRDCNMESWVFNHFTLFGEMIDIVNHSRMEHYVPSMMAHTKKVMEQRGGVSLLAVPLYEALMGRIIWYLYYYTSD